VIDSQQFLAAFLKLWWMLPGEALGWLFLNAFGWNV